MRQPVLRTVLRRDERSIVGTAVVGRGYSGLESPKTKSWGSRHGTRKGNSILVPTIASSPKTDLAHSRKSSMCSLTMGTLIRS